MQQTSPNWNSPCHTLKSNCANDMPYITAEGAWALNALTPGTYGTQDIMLYCTCLLIPAGRHHASPCAVISTADIEKQLTCQALALQHAVFAEALPLCPGLAQFCLGRLRLPPFARHHNPPLSTQSQERFEEQLRLHSPTTGEQ